MKKNLWWLMPLATWCLFGAIVAEAQQGFNQRAVVSFSASGDNTIVAGATGKKVLVWGWDISCASPTNLTFKSGASTSLTGSMLLAAYSKPLTNIAAYIQTNPGDALVINDISATACAGILWYSVQ